MIVFAEESHTRLMSVGNVCCGVQVCIDFLFLPFELRIT